MQNFNEKALAVTAEVSKAVLGKPEVVLKIMMAMLARGHVLIEDIPGVGKTTLAQAFARAMDLTQNRVQFTPDVLPSDIVGFSLYQKETGKFVYHPGAVACNLFLADEINRTSARTQSALLEVMEESAVTVDGVTRPLPQPVTVMLEGVEHQSVLPVELLHQLHKSVDFAVMDMDGVPVPVVNCPVAKLQELVRQDAGALGRYGVFVHLQQQVRLQLGIGFLGRSVECHRNVVMYDVRQGEVVAGLHADADVADGSLNHLEAALLRVVAEDGRAVSLAGNEVPGAICAQRPAQPYTAVQQVNLRPQVFKAVAGWSAGQLHDSANPAADQPQGLEPLALGVLEARTLVQHHHVERPRIFEVLDQPRHVLAVYHVGVCRRCQCSQPLLDRTENWHDPHHLQLVPLRGLRSPRGLGHLLRRDDERL